MKAGPFERVAELELASRMQREAEARGHWIAFPVHVKTVSEANSRDGWRKKWTRNQAQKESAFWAALGHPGTRLVQAVLDLTQKERVEVKLRRVAELVIARRANRAGLDDDNLRAALKYIRDGVARALDVDDGDPRVAWHYEQVPAPRGVCFTMVEIRRATSCDKVTTSRRRAPSSKRSALPTSGSAQSTTTRTAAGRTTRKSSSG